MKINFLFKKHLFYSSPFPATYIKTNQGFKLNVPSNYEN